jgi:hypothetical protein
VTLLSHHLEPLLVWETAAVGARAGGTDPLQPAPRREVTLLSHHLEPLLVWERLHTLHQLYNLVTVPLSDASPDPEG